MRISVEREIDANRSVHQGNLNQIGTTEQMSEAAQAGLGDTETTMESAAPAESRGFCSQFFDIFEWMRSSISNCAARILTAIFGSSNKFSSPSTAGSDAIDNMEDADDFCPTPPGELDESDDSDEIDRSDRSVTVGQLRARLLQGIQHSHERTNRLTSFSGLRTDSPDDSGETDRPDPSTRLIQTVVRNQDLIRRLTSFSALHSAMSIGALNVGGYLGSREHLIHEFNRLDEGEKNELIARMGLLAVSDHHYPISEALSRDPEWGRRVIYGVVREAHETADRPDIRYHSDNLIADGSVFRRAINAIESERHARGLISQN